MITTPDVFIIESLRFDDEENGHLEGKFISHILNLADRKVRYYYIRTRAELEEVLDIFEDSGFRYLHFSCHADENGIALTLDELSIEEMGRALSPLLNKRRIFFSACEIATQKLASVLLKNTGCYSVIGPSKSVGFDEAALFWASLYHLMFKDDITVMKRKHLRCNIQKLSTIFDIGIRYFASSKQAKKGYVEVTFDE